MISLYAIISDYFTIIRDYFYDYISDYISDYNELYAIIFSIISDYFTASAPGRWECTDNHGGMTGQCQWRMPAHLHRLEQQSGRRADRMKSCLMERSCTIIRIIFSLMRIICLGRTGLLPLKVRPMHCVSMYTHSVRNNEPMEHRRSCRSCQKCPNCNDYSQLLYIISQLLRLFFRLYALCQKWKSHLWLEFIADYRPISSSITEEQGL